jgi:ANTAR domain
VRGIQDAADGIIPSDEPAVVLSSLARSSNPSFSDACAIELSEGTEPCFRVCFPLPDEEAHPSSCGPVRAAPSAPSTASKTISTAFQASSGHGYQSFAGIVVHSWTERDPTEEDAIIARLLVDLALAIMQRERLAQTAARAEDRAAKLAVEVISSRIEGEATGILMTQHQITRNEAVSLLRQASRTSRRELHEVAAGVVLAGDFHRLPHNRADSPPRGPDAFTSPIRMTTGLPGPPKVRPASQMRDHCRRRPGTEGVPGEDGT